MWSGRVSSRGRLALLFALGSAALLTVSAALVYWALDGELQRAINEGLQARADDLGADVARGQTVVPPQEPFAEILDPGGHRLSSSRPQSRATLSPAEVRRALHREVFLDRRAGSVPELGRKARLLARPVGRPANAVVVVGSSLDTILRGRHRLALSLIVASPLLLAALATGGWLLAGAALRPVLEMTREADRISLQEPGRRLPRAPGSDEIAQLGLTLNAMLDRIEASFHRERAFVDDASHELRTPLSVLRGELELAVSEAAPLPAVEWALSSALEEVDRLSRLANDLLVLARASAGELPLRPETLDLSALARRVAARVTKEDGGPAVGVEGDKRMLRLDPERTEQVLVNLISNARRHARRRVQIGVEARADSVQLVVADDGAGFPADLLPRAFDRFVRGDLARGRAQGGAGLGLAIAAALVQAQGGTITAGNGDPLGGAVVRVRFPKDARPAPAAAAPGATVLTAARPRYWRRSLHRGLRRERERGG